MADYELEVELVDGHRMTVTVEDAESSFIAATRAGDEIVRSVRAKLTGAVPCPKCRDSGIELLGAYMARVPEPPSGGVMRRVVCECAHGRALLEHTGDGGRRYPEVQRHLDEPEAVARPRTDGQRGWEAASRTPTRRTRTTRRRPLRGPEMAQTFTATRRAELTALLAVARRRVRAAGGRMRFGDPCTTTECGSCRTGEHQCGGCCDCQRAGCAGGPS